MKRLVAIGILLLACKRDAPPAAPTSSITVASAAGADAGILTTGEGPTDRTFRLPATVHIEPGCFAWSRDRHEVLCWTGQRSNLNGEAPPAHLQLVAGGRDQDEWLDLAASFDELSDSERPVLAKRLSEGRYLELPPPSRLDHDTSMAGFDFRVRRELVVPRGNRYTTTLQVSAHDALLILDVLANQPCEAVVQTRELPGLGLLVERICHIADEGEYGYDASAWLLER